MHYATTQGDETVNELAGRIFGVGPRTKLADRAAKALREANPMLEELASLPKGSPVAVPDLEGARPAVRLRSLPDFATRGALRSARADVEPLGGLLTAIADERRESAGALLERLRSPEVKRAAKADPATAARVERAIARAERQKTAATELKAATRRALAALEEEIARLLA